MSERLTGIVLRGIAGCGWSEWGRKSVPEMVAIYRRRADQMKADAEAILAADDADFHVDTYLGPHAMRDREVLQQGK